MSLFCTCAKGPLSLLGDLGDGTGVELNRVVPPLGRHSRLNERVDDTDLMSDFLHRDKRRKSVVLLQPLGPCS